MSPLSDAWYVRLPNGRVLRATSTRSVRRHVGKGRIPTNCRLRRSSKDQWVPLERLPEFADLAEVRAADGRGVATPRGVAAHLDADRLRTIGVRGLVDELLAALDCALVRPKLAAACLTGLLGGALGVAAWQFAGDWPAPWPALARVAAVGILLVALAVCHAALMQMTFIELSHLRPARPGEVRLGLARNSFRLCVAYLVVVGGALAAFVALRNWPVLVGGADVTDSHAARGAVAAAAVVLEIILWPLLASAFLLGAAAVVEDCPLTSAIGQVWRLLGEQFLRVVFFEAFAVGVGTFLTLPFGAPLAVAALGLWSSADDAAPVAASLIVVTSLVAAPLVAYVAVVHVFIYVSLRYETASRRP